MRIFERISKSRNIKKKQSEFIRNEGAKELKTLLNVSSEYLMNLKTLKVKKLQWN